MTLIGKNKYKEELSELARVLIAELVFGDKLEGFEVIRGDGEEYVSDGLTARCNYYQCPGDIEDTSVVRVYRAIEPSGYRTFVFHSKCVTTLIFEYL